MKAPVFVLLLGSLISTVLNPASAPARTVLTLQDHGNTTYDPNTGLEWLDLRFTSGQSYLSVLNGWGGYTTSQGFRFATRNEVVGLFTDAGATGVNANWNTADAQPAGQLLSLTGITLSLTGLNRSWMFYDPATEPSLPTIDYAACAVFGVWNAPGSDQGVFSVPGLYPLQDYASPELASALVRTVPEPSPAMLLAFGLAVTLFGTQWTPCPALSKSQGGQDAR